MGNGKNSGFAAVFSIFPQPQIDIVGATLAVAQRLKGRKRGDTVAPSPLIQKKKIQAPPQPSPEGEGVSPRRGGLRVAFFIALLIIILTINH